MRIGCFDQRMRLMGYGIKLENGKSYASGNEQLPIRKETWEIAEGIFQQDGVEVHCNSKDSEYCHSSRKHKFIQEGT